jgi:hypothetical protein
MAGTALNYGGANKLNALLAKSLADETQDINIIGVAKTMFGKGSKRRSRICWMSSASGSTPPSDTAVYFANAIGDICVLFNSTTGAFVNVYVATGIALTAGVVTGTTWTALAVTGS